MTCMAITIEIHHIVPMLWCAVVSRRIRPARPSWPNVVVRIFDSSVLFPLVSCLEYIVQYSMSIPLRVTRSSFTDQLLHHSAVNHIGDTRT